MNWNDICDGSHVDHMGLINAWEFKSNKPTENKKVLSKREDLKLLSYYLAKSILCGFGECIESIIENRNIVSQITIPIDISSFKESACPKVYYNYNETSNLVNCPIHGYNSNNCKNPSSNTILLKDLAKQQNFELSKHFIFTSSSQQRLFSGNARKMISQQASFYIQEAFKKIQKESLKSFQLSIKSVPAKRSSWVKKFKNTLSVEASENGLIDVEQLKQVSERLKTVLNKKEEALNRM